MKQSILILIVLVGLLLGGCSKTSKPIAARTGAPLNDTDFAKETFRLLAEGDSEAIAMIDWEHLKMLEVDVGSMYAKINDDNSRDRFLKGFIGGYSRSFKQSGGSPDNVSNWREQSRDASNTIVAADGPGGKLLLMTVAHIGGQQKVSLIELK